MTLSEIFKNRRSIRNFRKNPVSIEIIQHIIDDSVLAPSAGNGQPWKFVIVRNREIIDRISTDCKKNFLDRFASNPVDHAIKYKKMLQNESFHIFYHAPAVVLIVGEEEVKNLVADCALAASYFMLSATSKGLGTCWVNFGKEIHDPKLLAKIGIPEGHQIVVPLALGYPNKIPVVPSRKQPQILKIVE